MKQRLLTYCPSHLTSYGVVHAALSITQGMNSQLLSCFMYVPSGEESIKSDIIKKTIPTLLAKVLYRLFSPNLIRSISEGLFFRKIKSDDVIYLWPGVSMALIKKIKAKGNIVVMENINCHQVTSKRILDEEAKRINIINIFFSIPQAKIEFENEAIEICDYIFSPSPLVTKSLLVAGVTEGKILESSYGLNKSQQLDLKEKQDNSNALEFIFVGRVGLRKGVHLLLQYWCEAEINGTLKIIGNVEESIKNLIEPYRNVHNIQFINFVDDIEAVYKSADVFVLPSLEEGSPLVTYLALGAGLPCIVSPMGGLGVVTDEKEGFIIEAHDKTKWVNALQSLANSAELRKAQSIAARNASNKFLWANVGKQRAGLLMQKLQEK